jgi:carbonic anhydrase
MQEHSGTSLDTKAAEVEGKANQLEITIEDRPAEAEKAEVAAQVQKLREESAALRQKAQAERVQALKALGHVPAP